MADNPEIIDLTLSDSDDSNPDSALDDQFWLEMKLSIEMSLKSFENYQRSQQATCRSKSLGSMSSMAVKPMKMVIKKEPDSKTYTDEELPDLGRCTSLMTNVEDDKSPATETTKAAVAKRTTSPAITKTAPKQLTLKVPLPISPRKPNQPFGDDSKGREASVRINSTAATKVPSQTKDQILDLILDEPRLSIPAMDCSDESDVSLPDLETQSPTPDYNTFIKAENRPCRKLKFNNVDSPHHAIDTARCRRVRYERGEYTSLSDAESSPLLEPEECRVDHDSGNADNGQSLGPTSLHFVKANMVEGYWEEDSSEFVMKGWQMLMDFTTTIEYPSKWHRKRLLDYLAASESLCDAYKIYAMLQHFDNLHPLKDDVCFEWCDLERSIKSISSHEPSNDLQSVHVLILQYMVDALWADLMSHDFGRRLDFENSTIYRWIYCASSMNRIRFLAKAITESSVLKPCDLLSLHLEESIISENDRHGAAENASLDYLSLLQKLMEMVILASKKPNGDCLSIALIMADNYAGLTETEWKRHFIQTVNSHWLRFTLTNKILQGHYKTGLPDNPNNVTPVQLANSVYGFSSLNGRRNECCVEELAVCIYFMMLSFLCYHKAKGKDIKLREIPVDEFNKKILELSRGKLSQVTDIYLMKLSFLCE